MKRQTGIGIDHRGAFVVSIDNGVETEERIESGMEKHVRFSRGSQQEDGSADDQRDRQYADHLRIYYDDVISKVRDAKSILLVGPGEAKGELEKRLTGRGLGGRIVGVETADRMTVRQIAARVRQYYQTV